MNKRQYKLTTHELTYISLAMTLITVCAWIAIPFGDIPVTLQTFAIFVVTSLLGIRRSLLALLVYLLMGLVGLPVFSGMTGGLGRIIGPTGGYLIGFVFTILIEGTITHRLGKRLLIFASSMALGMAACYAFGTLWFAAVYMGDLSSVGIGTVLIKCVIPYIIPDCVKIGVAVWIVPKIEKGLTYPMGDKIIIHLQKPGKS